ncbi:hypothetical protein [Haloquadratum walsbyi]|nr:hypothetical protein [Haloquadratum walsbyi]
MGGPDTEQYRAFEQFVTRRNLSIHVPRHVAEKMGESLNVYV